MVIGSTSTSTSVIISGSVNSKGIAMTLATANRNSNGTTAIVTVPANHEYDVYFADIGNSAAAACYGNITLDGVVVCHRISTATPTDQGNAFSHSNYITLVAGKVINLNVWGWGSGTLIGTIAYVDRTV